METKPKPKWEEPGGKFTEIVTVRSWDAAGKRFLDAHERQPAYPVKLAGQDGFALKAIFLFPPGSEIVQADGTTWTVVRSHLGDRETRCIVTNAAGRRSPG